MAEDEWQDTGHPWIGSTVLRFFDGQPVQAAVTKWLPPSDDESALWHLEHSDGDQEDLELEEMQRSLQLWEHASEIEEQIEQARARLEQSVRDHGEMAAQSAAGYMQLGKGLLRRYEFLERASAESEEQDAAVEEGALGEEDAAVEEGALGEEDAAVEDNEGTGEQEDGPTELELVWENLDAARKIFETHNANQLEIAELRLALGDVAMHAGDGSQAGQGRTCLVHRPVRARGRGVHGDCPDT